MTFLCKNRNGFFQTAVEISAVDVQNSHSNALMRFAGFPMTVTFSGTLAKQDDPDPTIALFPTESVSSIVEPDPIGT